jgi:hypothetical protein
VRKQLKSTLVQALRGLFDELFLQESRNVYRWRQQRALAQTGEFIEAQLPNVHSFETRYALWEYILKTQRIAERDGLICEFGVAKGKSINVLAEKLNGKKLYGFDSFQGLPETWRGNYPAGTFKTALPAVRENVELIPGWFNETLPGFLETHPEPALLLHLDADLYSSTKIILELMRPRLVPGTVLVFDEFFNYPGWLEGEYKAFNEFVAATGLKYEFLGYNNLGTQLALQVL